MSCCDITPLKELELVNALRYSDVIQENRAVGRSDGTAAAQWLPGLVVVFDTVSSAYIAWDGATEGALAVLACCYNWEAGETEGTASLIISGALNLNTLYLESDPAVKLTTSQQDSLRNYSIVVKNQRDNAVTIGA